VGGEQRQRARPAAFAADVPDEIARFLHAPTPRAWLEHAVGRLPELLNDHANCELKAASTALATIFRYPDHAALTQRMSRLAREELRHYEQVSKLLRERGIDCMRVAASGYAAGMRAAVNTTEPQRLRDTLICGAYIEARSCERFAALLPLLDETLARFYASLLASEARHFEQYLDLAGDVVADDDEFAARVLALGALEAELITTPDARFAFHSGPPLAQASGGKVTG
jgi:tRNA-(ms[2]io[6]A)-hydroxylase